MHKKFLLEFFDPDWVLKLSFQLLLIGLVFSTVESKVEWLGIFASLSGILGALLTSRKIFRLGISQLVVDEKTINGGGFSPSPQELEENRQYDIDVVATHKGALIAVHSAFWVFLVELVRFSH